MLTTVVDSEPPVVVTSPTSTGNCDGARSALEFNVATPLLVLNMLIATAPRFVKAWELDVAPVPPEDIGITPVIKVLALKLPDTTTFPGNTTSLGSDIV